MEEEARGAVADELAQDVFERANTWRTGGAREGGVGGGCGRDVAVEENREQWEGRGREGSRGSAARDEYILDLLTARLLLALEDSSCLVREAAATVCRGVTCASLVLRGMGAVSRGSSVRVVGCSVAVLR